MAENTRSQEVKRLDESIRKLLDLTRELIRQLTEVTDRHTITMEGFNERMEGLKNLITALNAKYNQIQEKVSSSTSSPILQNTLQNIGQLRTFQPKLDFPRFYGEDPAAWIYKCEKNMIDENQKLRLASLHMEEKAMQWYRWYEKFHTLRSWREFSRVLLLRFGDDVYEDATRKLTKLRQWTSVKAYQEKFEELATKTTGLSEEFFISYFVSGHKDEIKGGVVMLQPRTISQAMGLARLQEETVEAVNKKNKVPSRHAVSLTANTKPQDFVSKSAELRRDIKRLTPKDFDEKRAKGLCFGCDEKYFRGHVCKKKQLFMIGLEDDEEEFMEAQQEMTQEDNTEEFHISMHALSGM